MPDVNRFPAFESGRGIDAAVGPGAQRFLSGSAFSGCAIVVLAAGCTMDRPVRVRLTPEVERPQRAAVFFFVDGFGRDSFHRALGAGDLPNVQKHLVARGVSVDHAVAALPTITYSNSVTFLTGQFPGHHGIISNRWFDPTIGLARDYCTVATYQQADQDYVAPTLHDLLRGRGTVSVQAAQRRGCDRTYDNMISSGVNWFFGNYGGVDCMVAQNFGEIGDHARRCGRWPTFVIAYFPGVDHVCHDHGPTSPEYRRILQNLDRQIGHICDALKQAGMYDRTYLVLGSDHGLAEVRQNQVLDVPAALHANSGRPVSVTKPLADDPRMIDRVDAVCAMSGSRWMAVHIRDGGDWKRRYFSESEAAAPFAGWLGGAGGPGAAGLLDHPAIELAAGKQGENAVWVRTHRGRASIRREVRDGTKFYCYEPAPADALGYRDDPTVRSFVEAGWHPSRDWLAATVTSRYPDLVPQLPEMFDSPRAGDIVLFASAGWDFSHAERAAAHGSILPQEMLVPMLIAGPGITPGQTIPVARNCDVMPTILDLLAADAPRSGAIDGVSLVPQFQVKREVAAQ